MVRAGPEEEVHTVLRMIPESPRDTRAQVCISPGVIHWTWTGCPLVDTTWASMYNPHFKAKATEAWSASEICLKGIRPLESSLISKTQAS